MKIKVFLAIAACRLTRGALRLLGRGGTALPGKVALKLCPDLLKTLARGVKTIVVTGTNGKTTCSRIVEQMLADAGHRYFANRSGSNLLQGITCEYAMHATLSGKPKCEYAVIECDEAASKRVCQYTDPAVVLVTNVFRDQLDRFGEVLTTLENIKIGLRNSPHATLCVNADCSLSVSAAEGLPNPVIYYGVDTEIYKNRVSEVSDAPHCIHCMSEYEYDYVTYGHLGGFRCPNCGYHRPTPQVAVTDILSQTADATAIRLRVGDETLETQVAIPGGYNVYNAAAAVAAARALGIGTDIAMGAVNSFQCGFGRMEKLDLDGCTGRMILVKNPAGCNQVLNFLTNLDGETLFVCMLNDNLADGTDVSWIYDVNFEKLLDMGQRLSGVLCSGCRAWDMALRLKYAGLPMEKLQVIEDYDRLIAAMQQQDKPVVIMPTYTAMLDFRGILSRRFGIRQFWE